jgi:hypothetical protein
VGDGGAGGGNNRKLGANCNGNEEKRLPSSYYSANKIYNQKFTGKF